MAFNFPAKQDVLVSGTNIQTINGNSILGSGNLTITGVPSFVAGDANKVLVTDGTSASWQYAGLGAGSFGTNNVILGRTKPTSFTTANANIIINTSTTNTITSAADNVIIGTNAGDTLTTTTNSVLIGKSATGVAGNSERMVAIGRGATASTFSTAVGDQASATGSESTAIGILSSVTQGYSIAIGGEAKATAVETISIGGSAPNDFPNSCAIGSSLVRISTLFIGTGANGKNTGTGYPIKIMSQRPTTAANVDLSAGTVTLAGAQSTGNALGGDVILATAPAGVAGGTTANAHVERIRCKAATEVVVNDTGVDFDFRVEGDTDANLLFVDASTDKVGIGTSSPQEKLDVGTGNLRVSNGNLILNTAGNGLTIKEGTNAKIGVTGAFPGGGTNTVTVSTTAVTSNSIIFISAVSGATTIDPKVWVSTITAGTSFVISSGDNSFTGTVGWMIVERS